MSSSLTDADAPVVTPTADRPRYDVGLMIVRVVGALILLAHGVQNLSHPATHISDTADFGMPLASVTGWLSMLGEAGLGALLLVGLATRVAGALAAVLMLLTFLVDVHAEGLITDQPGVTSESALLIAAVGAGVALMGADRYTLSGLLRLPAWLR